MNDNLICAILFILGIALLSICYVVAYVKFGVAAWLCVMGASIGTVMYTNALSNRK